MYQPYIVFASCLVHAWPGLPSPETVADRMAASGMSSLREPPSSPFVTSSSVRTGSPDFALS